MRIVKVGGSVAAKIKEIVKELKKIREDILIVPGGWIFADLVKEKASKEKLNCSTSHWMAIASMEIYAHYISNFGARAIEGLDFSGVCVLLPYRLLRETNELPHSWDVTADSIAVWLASKLNHREVIKLTDVDGIFINGELVKKITASYLIENCIQTCVDAFSPYLMRRFSINMFVCNGMVRERIKDYIVRGQAKGTLIEGR
jgi:hypothetical protein